MKIFIYLILFLLVVVILVQITSHQPNRTGVTIGDTSELSNDEVETDEIDATTSANKTHESSQDLDLRAHSSDRTVNISQEVVLPLEGSAPTSNVRHTIDVTKIRQGCFRQDCIPSVDDPSFISVNEAKEILPSDSIGIGLTHKGIKRFYPFLMLATREIVNDVVAGDPLLITYCPLCGTGIVFERTVDGQPEEFGVSGMLWQSNLLMYNRAVALEDRNLWSQVLGEAVVGNRAGEQLTIVPSDIVRFGEWTDVNQDAEVLTTGSVRDPYDGDYFSVAKSFAPDFDQTDSPLPPMTYVYGIVVDGTFKAYPRDLIPVGEMTDKVNGKSVTISKAADGSVVFLSGEEQLPDVEGFWFSWVAAHPETELFQ